VVDVPTRSETDSERLAEVRARANRRIRRQRDLLRPLGWALAFVVTAGAAGGDPRPGLQGKALAVTVALVVFVAALALAVADRFTAHGSRSQAMVIAAMGAASVALVVLQSQGATEMAGGAAVWLAITRLPLQAGAALAAVATGALDAAAAATGSSAVAILAATVVLALLALVAYFIRYARASQDRSELMLAELQDAREAQVHAAALAERSRIAGELHDVLAHSLSGAAIQLQAARKLAEREGATPATCAAIDRAGQLVREGLVNARQAVGALRGDALPGVAQLDALISSFRDDMALPVTLTVEGSARVLPAEVGLALYRGVQEALTNVARYAPRAPTSVVLIYGDNHTSVIVEDRVPAGQAAGIEDGLSGVGGGRGLAGLRERVARVGGTVHAGPIDRGWRVELAVPA
jgi:signal transduction histidine kinase